MPATRVPITVPVTSFQNIQGKPHPGVASETIPRLRGLPNHAEDPYRRGRGTGMTEKDGQMWRAALAIGA
jgi:hypothetical protein